MFLENIMELNKKGQSFTQLIWILRIIFWILVLITCYGIISYFIQGSFEPWQAEAETFGLRMFYSPNGISYFDPVAGKIQPGTVDLMRFKERIWQESFFYEEEHLAAKMVLRDMEGNLIIEDYVNEALYERWESLGAGVAKFSKKYYVLIKDEGQIEVLNEEKDLADLIEERGENVILVENQRQHLEEVRQRAVTKTNLVKGFLEMEIIIEK